MEDRKKIHSRKFISRFSLAESSTKAKYECVYVVVLAQVSCMHEA